MLVLMSTRIQHIPYPTRKPPAAPPPVLLQTAIAMVGGIGLFLFLIMISLILFDFSHAGRIYPGVSLAGMDLSGLKPTEAQAQLAQFITYPQTGKIVFRDGEKVWLAKPADLGLMLDPQTSAQAAYLLGRTGNPFIRLTDRLGAWYTGTDLAPFLIYGEGIAQDYLNNIARQVDLPTIEASLNVSGKDVVVLPGQVGRKVNVAATLAVLEPQLRSLTDGLIPLVIQETPPAILDASQQAEIARQILSAPLTLEIPATDPTLSGSQGKIGPYLVTQDQLGKMLTIQRLQASEGARYQVQLSDDALRAYLEGLSPDLDQQASNARFIFNDDTRQLEVIQPAVIGRALDIDATIQAIQAKIAEGQHTVSLKLIYTQPDVGDNATGEQLGIKELIVSQTSYFRGSSSERLQNIKIAAANFHGLLVPPGAVFSMASAMGSVSLDTGYSEAWIIFGGRTIKGVGGGVCQVSTTLFRTVFFGGYPIVERYPHAYRVGYYEQTRTGYNPDMAGLDATVFVPMVDFKFTNDTPYWLLMETYFSATGRSLTWKIYSTSDGRKVEWETTGPQNIIEPPEPVYEENPDLPAGKIRQVDWAAEGSDVTVTRTIYRDGQVLYYDVFTTHYLPWADVFQYGPGTDLSGKQNQPGFINPL